MRVNIRVFSYLLLVSVLGVPGAWTSKPSHSATKFTLSPGLLPKAALNDRPYLR
jgi:hypothetical protein